MANSISSAERDLNIPRPLRIFLCHASQDKSAVRSLCGRLSEDGFVPWIDENDLLPGQDWQREIPRAVKASDVVIVCLSNSFNKAGYRQKEVRLALDAADEQPEETIFLIPLKLEPCDVPTILRRWQWVDLFESTGYQRLQQSLNRRWIDLHGPGLSSPTQLAGVPAFLDKRRRTREIVDCLKARYIYSPKDIRDLFLAALSDIAPSLTSQPLRVGELSRRALKRATELASAESITYQFWLPATDAIFQMFLAAGVLIGVDGRPLKPGIHSRAESVSLVDNDVRDKCEKFLLKYVIAKLGNVTQRDRTALAHALFKVSPKKKQLFDLLERVDELLSSLRNEVHENSHGVLVVNDTSFLAFDGD